ncbi:MAG: hypothetical protein J6S85_13325 [Methanobrevibacter sp.]|nr:hypothetical protein [Methanobrevibacter sp.]
MKFSELPVRSKFIILWEHNEENVYTKINDRKKYNASFHKEKFTVHGATFVKEIKE